MMKALLMAIVRGYRLLLSPWLGSACRFEPTCSVYSCRRWNDMAQQPVRI